MITTLQAKTDMLTILRLISSKHRPVARFNPKVCNTSVQCTSIAILAVHTNKIITIRTILYSTFYPFLRSIWEIVFVICAPSVAACTTSENAEHIRKPIKQLLFIFSYPIFITFTSIFNDTLHFVHTAPLSLSSANRE